MIDPIVVFNILLSLVCLWIGLFTYERFVVPAQINEKRYRLYELRDQLSILVMKGEIEEGSEQHLVLLDIITSTLHSTEDCDVVKFVRCQIEMFSNKDLQGKLVHALNKVTDQENSEEYLAIVSETLDINASIFERHTKWLRFGLNVSIIALVSASGVIRSTGKLLLYLRGKHSAVLGTLEALTQHPRPSRNLVRYR
jgi:hypothetical protein